MRGTKRKSDQTSTAMATGLAGRGGVEIVPNAPPDAAPVAISAAIVQLLPTIQMPIKDEVGVGVRFDVPYSQGEVLHMVELLAPMSSLTPTACVEKSASSWT